MIASAALLPPIKAKTSMSPVLIIGAIVARPLPLTKFNVPGGRCFWNASIVRICANPLNVGTLRITIFPLRRAGSNVAYVSLIG